jgi:hypothetical protein
MLVGVHNVHLCCLPVSTHFVSFTDHDVNSLLFVTNVTNLQTPLNVKAFASPLGTRNLTFIWELTKAKHGERIGCNGIVFGNLSLIFPIHIYRGRNSTHKKSCHKLAFFVKTVQLRFFISEQSVTFVKILIRMNVRIYSYQQNYTNEYPNIFILIFLTRTNVRISIRIENCTNIRIFV